MEATREFYRRSNPAERVTVSVSDEVSVRIVFADGVSLWSTRSQFAKEYAPLVATGEQQAFSDLPPRYYEEVHAARRWALGPNHRLLTHLVEPGFIDLVSILGRDATLDLRSLG